MADKWIPDDILALQPKSSNITENPTTVQFNHRILGTSTLTLISVLWLISRKRILPPRAYTATVAFGIMAWIQVSNKYVYLTLCEANHVKSFEQTSFY